MDKEEKQSSFAPLMKSTVSLGEDSRPRAAGFIQASWSDRPTWNRPAESPILVRHCVIASLI